MSILGILVVILLLHPVSTKFILCILLTIFAVVAIPLKAAVNLYHWILKDREVIEGKFHKVNENQKCITVS
jgi:hypothetical protein